MADAFLLTVQDCPECGDQCGAELTVEPDSGECIIYCARCGLFTPFSKPELIGIKHYKERTIRWRGIKYG